jgi:hypothetical protein
MHIVSAMHTIHAHMMLADTSSNARVCVVLVEVCRVSMRVAFL